MTLKNLAVITALGLQCRANPGKACMRCTKLSLQCGYKLPVPAPVTAPAFQPKGASSSEGYKVNLFPGSGPDKRTGFTRPFEVNSVSRILPDGDISAVNDTHEQWVRGVGKKSIAHWRSTDESKQVN